MLNHEVLGRRHTNICGACPDLIISCCQRRGGSPFTKNFWVPNYWSVSSPLSLSLFPSSIPTLSPPPPPLSLSLSFVPTPHGQERDIGWERERICLGEIGWETYRQTEGPRQRHRQENTNSKSHNKPNVYKQNIFLDLSSTLPRSWRQTPFRRVHERSLTQGAHALFPSNPPPFQPCPYPCVCVRVTRHEKSCETARWSFKYTKFTKLIGTFYLILNLCSFFSFFCVCVRARACVCVWGRERICRNEIMSRICCACTRTLILSFLILTTLLFSYPVSQWAAQFEQFVLHFLCHECVCCRDCLHRIDWLDRSRLFQKNYQ